MAELDIHLASSAEREVAHRNVYLQWPAAPTLEEHVRFRMESPRHSGASWFVACLDGEVICSLSSYPFGFRVRGEELSGLGIGSVFTVPEHRGQGYAPRLMAQVEELARARGTDMSILYSDLVPHYYERLGYVTCPALCGWRAVEKLSAVEPVRLREFVGAEEIERLAALYDADHRQRLMSVVRDRTNWEVAIAQFPQDRFFWLEEDSRSPTAYARVRAKDGALRIVDSALAPEARGSEEAFYTALLSEARSAGLRRLGGWLIDSAVGRSFFDEEARSDEIPMVKRLTSTDTVDAECIAATAGFCELDHV